MLEKLEKDHRKSVEQHKTELAAERKRRQRAKQVLEDVKIRKRDDNGKLLPKPKLVKVPLCSIITLL